MNMLTTLATSSNDGSEFFGLLLIFGVLYAMYKAMTRKKKYDVRIGGTVTER